ncbi:MAG: PPOX class F420-dependent oxidoreductase [Acidimicrobiales bacterium]
MLDPRVRDAASGPNFGALSTLLPDGTPQTNVMWVGHDDDHLLINTEVHRQKYKNIRRDPRVSVAIWPRDDPYSFTEVRGVVVDEVRGPDAVAHIRALSMKYNGRDYDLSRIRSERVILKIEPTRVVVG